MAYPYSRAETIADGTVHAMALAASITAAVLLFLYATPQLSGGTITALGLYVSMILLSFTASAAYHLLPWTQTRPLLHRIDHAAIYLKIAGTYTPLVVLIGSAFAYVLLAVVWIVALAGAVAKLSVWATDARGSLALYLALGWLSVLLVWPMWQTLPGETLALIVVGGALYSLGTIVFAAKSMRYQNAIWHVFVLAASACFFGAITVGVTA
mgnify:CR=1 FL=1